MHLVPGFRPDVNGVGDYALLLASRLRERFGIESAFLVAKPAWRGAHSAEGFALSALRSRQPGCLVEAGISPDTPVILHYVPHGYAPRGCPVWLLRALRQAAPSLVTIFHETYATAGPSSSQFWLSPLQQHLGARLVRMSRACLTSTQIQAGVLRRWGASDARLRVSPVPSNVGEPDECLAWAQRRSRLILFGGKRRRIYADATTALERLQEALNLEEIIDIGPLVPDRPDAVGAAPVRALGPLEPEEIAHWFNSSRYGVVDYPHPFLGKSGVFAAYCAYGITTVNLGRHAGVTDGLEPGVHTLGPEDLPLEATRAAAVAAAAHAWYRERGSSRLARCINEALSDIDADQLAQRP